MSRYVPNPYTPLKVLYPEDWACWSPERRKVEETYARACYNANVRADRAVQKNQEQFYRRDREIRATREAAIAAARRTYELAAE